MGGIKAIFVVLYLSACHINSLVTTDSIIIKLPSVWPSLSCWAGTQTQTRAVQYTPPRAGSSDCAWILSSASWPSAETQAGGVPWEWWCLIASHIIQQTSFIPSYNAKKAGFKPVCQWSVFRTGKRANPASWRHHLSIWSMAKMKIPGQVKSRGRGPWSSRWFKGRKPKHISVLCHEGEFVFNFKRMISLPLEWDIILHHYTQTTNYI